LLLHSLITADTHYTLQIVQDQIGSNVKRDVTYQQ